MPPQERIWLNDEKRLLPGPNRPCQKHQKHPIRFGAGWSFHMSAQDEKLLSEQCVFCHEFGLAPGKVSHGSQYERGSGWFGPVDEAVLERLEEAHACHLLDKDKKPLHSVRFPFV